MNTNKKYETMTYKNSFNEDIEVNLIASRYMDNDVLYLGLMTNEGTPYTNLTVNLNGIIDNNCSYVDTNNNKWAETFLKTNKIATPTGRVASSGFCLYPEYSV